MIIPEMAKTATEQLADDLIRFAQRMVATPSLSGAEGDVAALIVDEMKQLNYDEVWTDEVGNVVGKINGDGGPAILLNGHMDVVDPGPAGGWPQLTRPSKLEKEPHGRSELGDRADTHPAYCGAIVDGELWGRGSVDMKGPVAAMIYGASQFKQFNQRPPGDVLMTVAVMEEIGGLGTQFMSEQLLGGGRHRDKDSVASAGSQRHDLASAGCQRYGLHVDAAIVGEPSCNELRLGHRGRVELQVKFPGRSAHASAPELGINPHFAAAEFLKHLIELPLGSDPVLGKSTIAPTLYLTDQISANVIPGEVTLYLDWRNVPSETTEVVVEMMEDVLADIRVGGELAEHATTRVTEALLTTYTGAKRKFASVFPAFSTSPDCPLARAAHSVITETTGQSCSAGIWKFATDGGHLAAAGIPVIGFGPGDDRLAHTNQERISIADLKIATATYAPLIIALADAT